MTKRPLNKCKSCGDTWYPKGRDISKRCPNCGGTDIEQAGNGCAAFLLIVILAAVGIAIVPKSCSDHVDVVAPAAPQSTPPLPQQSPATAPSSPAPASTPALTPKAEFPKNVTATKELRVKLEHGLLGIKRGQAFVILGRVPEGYQASYGAFKFVVQTGDFQDAPPGSLAP